MHMSFPEKRAWLALGGFALAGLVGSWFGIRDWRVSTPLLFFYLILLLNTHYSVKVFTEITPRGHRLQLLLDTLLVVCYLTLAASLWNAALFTAAASALFICAALKYLSLRKLLGASTLLNRKISIDVLGIIACLFAFGGVFSPYPLFALYTWVILFFIANVHLFFVEPLYRLPQMSDEAVRSGERAL